MGNSACCASDDANTQFDVISTTEEKGDGTGGETTLVQQVAPLSSDEEAQPPPVAAGGGERSPEGSPERSPSAVSAASRGASRESKDQEAKEKLGINSPKKAKHIQAKVREFVRGMQAGHLVTLLTSIGSAEQGEVHRADAMMTLDKAAQTLSLTSPDGNIVCPLEKIHDLYHVEGDGKEVFPQKVTDSLSEEELDQLLMVRYTLEDGSRKAFLMLEATKENRSQFHQCGKILRAHVMREKAKAAEKA